MVTIEIVYAPLKRAILHMTLELPQKATVLDALNASGIYTIYPDTRGFPVGIFTKQVSLEYVLKDGDRIEVYRPLMVDPKENRRKKAHVSSGKKKS
jgi:putative ubiquitin-RnfH superfamily antitoxin RatB of RatAB toxin-antitoxin module